MAALRAFSGNAELRGALSHRLNDDLRLHEARGRRDVRETRFAHIAFDILRNPREQIRIVTRETHLQLLAEAAGAEGKAHARKGAQRLRGFLFELRLRTRLLIVRLQLDGQRRLAHGA